MVVLNGFDIVYFLANLFLHPDGDAHARYAVRD